MEGRGRLAVRCTASAEDHHWARFVAKISTNQSVRSPSLRKRLPHLLVDEGAAPLGNWRIGHWSYWFLVMAFVLMRTFLLMREPLFLASTHAFFSGTHTSTSVAASTNWPAGEAKKRDAVTSH